MSGDKKLTPEETEQNRAALRHVRAWLDYREMTQRRLAELLGMSEPSVSKWLQGKQVMSVAQFVQVAQLLDARPDELLFAPKDRARAGRYRRIAQGIEEMTDAELDALATMVEAMRKK